VSHALRVHGVCVCVCVCVCLCLCVCVCVFVYVWACLPYISSLTRYRPHAAPCTAGSFPEPPSVGEGHELRLRYRRSAFLCNTEPDTRGQGLDQWRDPETIEDPEPVRSPFLNTKLFVYLTNYLSVRFLFSISDANIELYTSRTFSSLPLSVRMSQLQQEHTFSSLPLSVRVSSNKSTRTFEVS
jgi:hypothetical protein